MKQIVKSAIAIILCIAFVLPLAACGKRKVQVEPEKPGQYWETIPENGPSGMDPSIWQESGEPNISVTIIGGDVGEKELDIQHEIQQNNIDSIYSLICSAVTADLTEVGFECGSGIAESIENDNYTAVGIYYQDPDINLFDSDVLQSVGFVEIASSAEPFLAPDREESIIAVTDLSQEESDIQLICTFNYESISSYHFVYQGQYVIYYQQTPMRIVYDVYDNEKSNYDLTLGSLYDYDQGRFIYDESVFGTYQPHSGVELFGETDYSKLENDLRALSEEQLRAGYIVSEFNVVYYSPESISTYLLSDEEDTFFGYSVAELTECLGAGTALTYSAEKGFQTAEIFEPTDSSYNWKSFLIKMGIGAGIIIVGAILTPVTGGASFGCALLTISKVAVSFALTSAIGTVAISTAVGMIQGKSINDVLRNATYAGLDSFATGFMIGAAIGSVGVVSGLIKPSACFVAGTPVAIDAQDGGFVYTSIENIKVGDQVLSYDEETGLLSVQTVTDTFQREVPDLVRLIIGDDEIITTLNHPFYSIDRSGWTAARSLKAGENVLSAKGDQKVQESEIIELETQQNVYNFTVENTHTYFVGYNTVLVHNACIQSQRNKAVKEAWKQEKEAVMNGTSKYNWTPKQIKELLSTGKIKGIEGHHILPVNELIGTAKESLIASADNIVFLSKANHIYVHAVGDSFKATIPRVLEVAPWVAKRLALLF